MKITFNGVVLTDLFDGITKINRDIGSGWTNNLQSQVYQGADFISQTINSAKVSFEFIKYGTTAEISQLKRKLAGILNSGEPAPLVFDDEPDLMYFAVIDGDQAYDFDFMKSTGTLTFIVPSGYAESVSTKKSSNITKQSAGKYKVIIDNKGTLDCFPTYKITLKGNTANVGIVGSKGVLQMGSVGKEVTSSTTTTSTKNFSQQLINAGGLWLDSVADDLYFTKGWKESPLTSPQNSKVYASQGVVKFNSTLDNPDHPYTSPNPNKLKNSGLQVISFNPINTFPADALYVGGALQINIPTDQNGDTGAQFFNSYSNVMSVANRFGQGGLLQLLYLDSESHVICGYIIEKYRRSISNILANEATFQFYVGGQEMQRVIYNCDNGGYNDRPAPGNNNAFFNEGKGGVSIIKSNDGVISYQLDGQSRVPSIAPQFTHSVCTSVYLFIGNGKYTDDDFTGFADINGVGSKMSNLTLRAFNFSKTNMTSSTTMTVNKSTLVAANPNKYQKGNILKVDMESGKIFSIYGATPAMQDLITGSKAFGVSPGQQEVDIELSSPVEADIEVTWKERYL
ncbi:MAG: phage tail family protein [Streptococcaceae bacterium]|jgi:predicted phage tail component-like protein|nr:phage tail family protein [Streptococcaceae bacterium]